MMIRAIRSLLLYLLVQSIYGTSVSFPFPFSLSVHNLPSASLQPSLVCCESFFCHCRQFVSLYYYLLLVASLPSLGVTANGRMASAARISAVNCSAVQHSVVWCSCALPTETACCSMLPRHCCCCWKQPWTPQWCQLKIISASLFIAKQRTKTHGPDGRTHILTCVLKIKFKALHHWRD